jgi:16S rRNA (guanine527-N7)-methyltransferase
MIAISDDEILEALYPYYPEATHPLCEPIRVYMDLLLRWNSRISLTAITKPKDILRFHFGESLYAVRRVPIRRGRLADVGSGAGFPAIPIGMVKHRVTTVLLESNTKKAAFLNEVLRELGLKEMEVYNGRMQAYSSGQNKFDLVTMRAVKVDKDFSWWAKHNTHHGALIILWVGVNAGDIIEKTTDWTWRKPLVIPGAERRVILVGKKSAHLLNVSRGTIQ